jgi:hypothetical protein
MWYQSARLITVQIGLLLSCFCSIAVATIGYVAAMLLVKIKEEEVGGRVKFEDAFVYAEVKDVRSRSVLWRRVERPRGKHDRFPSRYFPSIWIGSAAARAPADRERQ